MKNQEVKNSNESSLSQKALDVISRQAALDCFHDWIDRHGDVHTPDEMAEYRAIEELPSAQPEIVRCKDCKYWRRQTNYAGTPLSFGFCESDEQRGSNVPTPNRMPTKPTTKPPKKNG